MPAIVIAHTFCASRDTRISYGWCLSIQGYFCAVQNYAEKAELCKCFWYPKRKLGLTMHFSEIIKLQFGKNTIRCFVIQSFLQILLINYLRKCVTPSISKVRFSSLTGSEPDNNINQYLRTVPAIVIAHTFCASRDTRISHGWCLSIQGYFCAVQNYAEKAELCRCFWYPKRKLGVTMHFSEIIKLQFGKKRHTLLCISKLFTNIVD